MESVITLNDSLDTAVFYGVNNRNISCLRDQHPEVRIVARGYQVKVSGNDKAVERFTTNLHAVEQFVHGLVFRSLVAQALVKNQGVIAALEGVR